MYLKYLSFLPLILCLACSKIHQSPDGCVVAFIIAAEQYDMTKVWNTLGPEAQAYYNRRGENCGNQAKGFWRKKYLQFQNSVL